MDGLIAQGKDIDPSLLLIKVTTRNVVRIDFGKGPTNTGRQYVNLVIADQTNYLGSHY